MAATWNVTVVKLEGSVIGDELRAFAVGNLGLSGAAGALNCFSPMINIQRDPFWGRNRSGNGRVFGHCCSPQSFLFTSYWVLQRGI